ncbi:hypothetical protein [Nocardia gamkensis]|uniref:hypothetical protein n=1 Tax=Nocardia gamkensis TaxID=352869 RepID=UPI0037C899D4
MRTRYHAHLEQLASQSDAVDAAGLDARDDRMDALHRDLLAAPGRFSQSDRFVFGIGEPLNRSAGVFVMP